MDNSTAILVGAVPVGLSFLANGAKAILEMARTIREDRQQSQQSQPKSNGNGQNGLLKQIGDTVEHKLVMTNDRIDRMISMQEATSKSIEATGRTLDKMATVIDERMPRRRR